MSGVRHSMSRAVQSAVENVALSPCRKPSHRGDGFPPLSRAGLRTVTCLARGLSLRASGFPRPFRLRFFRGFLCLGRLILRQIRNGAVGRNEYVLTFSLLADGISVNSVNRRTGHSPAKQFHPVSLHGSSILKPGQPLSDAGGSGGHYPMRQTASTGFYRKSVRQCTVSRSCSPCAYSRKRSSQEYLASAQAASTPPPPSRCVAQLRQLLTVCALGGTVIRKQG